MILRIAMLLTEEEVQKMVEDNSSIPRQEKCWIIGRCVRICCFKASDWSVVTFLTFSSVEPAKSNTSNNRLVVPYNPYLSLTYNCHINVECCTSPKCVQYLYKYVTKGNDRAMVATEVQDQARNEIQEYQDLRSVGSSEATWHLMNFPITNQKPAVKPLRVHLKDQQQVVFDEEQELALS